MPGPACGNYKFKLMNHCTFFLFSFLNPRVGKRPVCALLNVYETRFVLSLQNRKLLSRKHERQVGRILGGTSGVM